MPLSSLFQSDSDNIVGALSNSFALIEFDCSGNILKANKLFLDVMGYELTEIVGKPHRIFVGSDVANSTAYRSFWTDLADGKPNAGEFRRFGKNNKCVWIEASYCPVRDRRGKVIKIVKLAADVTAKKLVSIENQAILTAVDLSQGIISFTPTGEVLDVNENFTKAMGYSKAEVIGKHHRLFVDQAYSASEDYKQFWARLAKGEFISQEFRRFGKGGKEVLIQAAYNPVFDVDGKVVKVVKMVFDLTERMESIGRLGAGLTRLAEGDLTHIIDQPLVQTMEGLRRDFNDAVLKLGDTLGRVVESSGGIGRATSEISVGADELSKRTEQQAASLEETAAAVDEITATGKKAAEGAEHARKVVIAAKQDAERTGEVVRKTVSAISNIEKSSQHITSIIGVIDEIAFQTNLLALNAGVEAARAGEAGRGFAVVASEVRALAQRSAEAAKEIKDLIQKSSAQVADGVTLVAETGKALERILVQVDEINNVVKDIASGAQEQSVGLHQVNAAINQMDQSTQQNAAMVEEATAASHAGQPEL